MANFIIRIINLKYQTYIREIYLARLLPLEALSRLSRAFLTSLFKPVFHSQQQRLLDVRSSFDIDRLST